MGAFKPASSPGRYGQQIAHVDNVSRLQKVHTRDRNDQVEYNKQIADAHREYSKSFTAGIGTETASRENAFKFEDYFHQIDQKFKLQGIEDAHASAVRNSQLQQQQTNKEANQLVNLVNKTLNTGVDIYKRVEKAKEIQKDNDASSVASQYSTTKDIVESRRLGTQYLAGEMKQDAFEAEAERLGRPPESILKLAGVSEGVYTLALQKTISRNINNLDRFINTDDTIVPGTGKTGPQIELEGDIAAANVAWQQKVQGMARLYKEQTGQDFPWATFNDPLQKAYSRYIGRISQVNRTNSAAQLQDQQQNKLYHALGAPALENNPKAQAEYLAQRQVMYPGLRQKDIDHIIAGAGIKGSGVTEDLLNEFARLPVLNKDGQPVNGMTYGDMYLTQLDEARDKLRSGRIEELNDYTYKQRSIYQTTMNSVNHFTRGGQKLNPADIEAIYQEAVNDGADASTLEKIKASLNVHAMSDGPGIEEAESWWSAMIADDQYLQHVTAEQILKVAPNSAWAHDKLKELRTLHRANPLTKDRETYIRNDLAKRLGVHGPDAYKDTTFIHPFREINTQWQEWEREGGGGAEGFKYAEAKFKQVYGEANDKTKQFDPTNPLAVFNAADNPGKTGFVNYQADASLAGDVGLYRDWSNAITAASGNSTRVSDRLKSLDKIDLSAIPAADVERFLKDFHNRKIMPNDPTMDLLRTLGDAITGTKGGNLNVLETAEALADVYNIDRKQFEPQVGVGKKIIDMQNQLQMKYGGSVAAHYTGVPSGEATWSGYTVQPGDREAIISAANDLGVDSRMLAALFHKESGLNPNIWGGDGKNYVGIIQFGKGARGETGLPSKAAWRKMTIPEQMPYVIAYLRGRGYGSKGTQIPGDHVGNIQRIYATILVGNPGGNIDAPDSNNTTVRKSMKGFLPGGDHYVAASKVLGFGSSIRGQTAPTVVPATVAPNTGTGRDGTFDAGTTGQGIPPDGPPKPEPFTTHMPQKKEDEIIILEDLGDIEGERWFRVQIGDNRTTNMTKREYLAQGGKL